MQSLKNQNNKLQLKEAIDSIELSTWQKQLIDERLNVYYQDSSDMMNFDKTIDDIEAGL